MQWLQRAARCHCKLKGQKAQKPKNIYTVEWNLGMWANCPNMGSPVSLGLFVCENKSKYFQKSHPQLRM